MSNPDFVLSLWVGFDIFTTFRLHLKESVHPKVNISC